MQSIRVILASFGLAPAAGMNNLTALLLDNLWHCWISTKNQKTSVGDKNWKRIPEPMQRHKPSGV